MRVGRGNAGLRPAAWSEAFGGGEAIQTKETKISHEDTKARSSPADLPKTGYYQSLGVVIKL